MQQLQYTLNCILNSKEQRLNIYQHVYEKNQNDDITYSDEADNFSHKYKRHGLRRYKRQLVVMASWIH